MLDPADTLAIHELLALYGHVIDSEQWSRLDELFTADVVFDTTGLGFGRSEGLEAVRERWSSSRHALGHHTTNVVILSVDAGGAVRAMSKGIGVHAPDRVVSFTYHDLIVPTPQGWRIAERVATQREAE